MSMRTNRSLYLAVLALSATTGCELKYWYQEGKTFDQCKADRKICRAELLRRADAYRLGSYERRFMEECMRQRGYRLVSESELPLDVKREDPDIPSEVPWARSYGLAGTLGRDP